MSDLLFDQLESGKPVKLEKAGKTICVTRVGDEVFAMDDTCTHSEASLSEGDVTDFKIECWLMVPSLIFAQVRPSHFQQILHLKHIQ